MRRLLPVLAVLALGAFPAAASAAESFLGVLPDGRAVRFTSQAPSALTTPKPVTGLESGDRVIALAPGAALALGRSGRIYRIDARTLRATPTAARIDRGAGDFSLVPAGSSVRVVSSAGLDVSADLATGAVTPGPGLRLSDGTAIAPLVAPMADGRLAGVDFARSIAVTETAPGTNLFTAVALTARHVLGRLPSPVAFAWGGGTAYTASLIPQKLRRPQSRFMRVNLATGAVVGNSGPFILRTFQTFTTLGQVADDHTAPAVSAVVAPRRILIRRLRIDGGLRVRVRCSEACTATSSLYVGRVHGFTSAVRDTPGVLTLEFFRITAAQARSLQRRIGRTGRIEVRVEDWKGNRRTLERHVTLTR